MPREIFFEGFTPDEILRLPKEQIDALILLGEPIVFRAGSSTILGSIKVDEDRLIIELAHIDGGGEGVLVSLGSLANTRFNTTCIASNGSCTPSLVPIRI